MSTPLSRAMDQMAETDRLLEENIRLQAEIERLKGEVDGCCDCHEAAREEIERLKAKIEDAERSRNDAIGRCVEAQQEVERIGLLTGIGELEAEVKRLRRDRGMLKSVHGALVDAGCRMGEIGHCEAELVRQITRERDEALRALFSDGADAKVKSHG